MKKYVAILAPLGVGLVAAAIAGGLAVRPFDRPEYAEIDTSESAFMIPMEGDTHDQAEFPSIEFLKARKVAAKRVKIDHRWNQTGFLPAQGSWISVVRLVKVDRRPVTREWTESHKSGTSAKDEAISAESRDSVNFTMGICCTANIPEESAATFLYTYPSKSLAEMLDMEVRARIQQVVAEEAAKYELDKLRARKTEIMAAVREDVIPFFKERGIHIATVAMLGGITYQNPEIQRAIDDAAKASQLKVAAEAKREAQEVENKTMKLAAEGRATAAKLEALSQAEVAATKVQGEAKLKTILALADAEAEIARADALSQVKLRAAEAEAEGIRKIAAARGEEARMVQESPSAYLQLKALETELQRWKQWDGKYPTYWLNLGGSAANVMLPLPPVPSMDGAKTVKADGR